MKEPVHFSPYAVDTPVIKNACGVIGGFYSWALKHVTCKECLEKIHGTPK